MKVGDKYIIEIEEVIKRYGAPHIARIKGFNALVFDQYGLEKLKPYDGEDAYDKGLNEAWELVKRIESTPEDGGLMNEQIAEVFGQYWSSFELYNSFSAEEALDLYKRWEDKQKQDAEIKVGDEVYLSDENHTRVVTNIFEDSEGVMAVQLSENGRWVADPIEELHKTGRHFDAIAEVLAELRGKE